MTLAPAIPPLTTDAITTEVVRHGLTAAAEQMATSIERSARSQVVREMLDYSSGVFDPTGGIIAQSTRIPIHLNSMTRPLKAILQDRYPLEKWREGDVFVINDPYFGGQHLPDVMAFSPVVVDNVAVAIVGTIVHHLDVGGRAPASYGADATEVFQEGFQIPPLRIVEEGVWNDVFLRLFERNIRVPAKTVGDLRAQVSALGTGANEVHRIVRRYSVPVFTRTTQNIIAMARTGMEEAISLLPQGVFRASDIIDGDGLDDTPIRIQVAVRKTSDNRLLIDFEGTDPQVQGPINSPIGATESAVYYGVSAVMQPRVVPICGAYEPIDIIAPSGSVLNPRRPAPVVGRSVFAHRIANIVMDALGQALPDRACAHHYGNSNVTIFSRKDEIGNSEVLFEIGVGGWGARPGMDGPDGLSQGVHNLRNNPIELVEHEFPCRVLNYSFIPDSGGAGEYRGGLGVERTLVMTADAEFTAQFDRIKYPAPGLLGGHAGRPGKILLEREGQDPVEVPGKVVGLRLKTGDVIRIQTQGGGGLGDPKDRSHERIRKDLALGKVTRNFLINDYGFTPQEVDENIQVKGKK